MAPTFASADSVEPSAGTEDQSWEKASGYDHMISMGFWVVSGWKLGYSDLYNGIYSDSMGFMVI